MGGARRTGPRNRCSSPEARRRRHSPRLCGAAALHAEPSLLPLGRAASLPSPPTPWEPRRSPGARIRHRCSHHLPPAPGTLHRPDGARSLHPEHGITPDPPCERKRSRSDPPALRRPHTHSGPSQRRADTLRALRCSLPRCGAGPCYSVHIATIQSRRRQAFEGPGSGRHLRRAVPRCHHPPPAELAISVRQGYRSQFLHEPCRGRHPPRRAAARVAAISPGRCA